MTSTDSGLGPERAIGCIVYPATEIVEPGVCQHIEGNTYSIGEAKRHMVEAGLAMRMDA